MRNNPISKIYGGKIDPFRKLRTIVVLLICFLTSVSCFSQIEGEWKLAKKLTVNNGGLPQSICIGLYFDKQTGFLWITTEGGLVRYNGVDTKVYDKRNLDITTSRLGAFYQTIDGRILTHEKWGKGIIIGMNEPYLQKLPDSLSYYNSLFMGYYNNPVYNVNLSDKANHSSCFYVPGVGPEELMPLRPQYKAIWINDSLRLVARNNTLFIMHFREILKQWAVKKWDNLDFIKRDNRIYIISGTGEGYLLDTKLLTLQPVAMETFFQHTDYKIFSDLSLENNYLLSGHKLYRVIVDNNLIRAVFFAELPLVPASITSLTVNPNNKQIYCGTVSDGLYIYTKSNFSVYKAPKDLETKSFEINNIYTTVLTDSNHAITNSSLSINLSTGATSLLPFSIVSRFVFDVWDKHYLLLPGGGYNGNMVDLRTNIVRKNEEVIKFPVIFKVEGDSNYRIATGNWIGTIAGNLIKKESMTNKELIRFVSNTPDAHIFEHSYIGKTFDNKLLFHNNQDTFYAADTTGLTFSNLFNLPFSSGRIPILDQGLYCWIPTYGNGFYLYDVQEHKLYKAPLDPKGFLQYAHTFAPDGKDNILITTNNGMFRINREHLIQVCKNTGRKLLYEYYDSNNGLETNEFNGGCIPAFNQLKNGDILFPSINGLVRVFTAEFQKPISYPLFVESITAADSIYSYKAGIHFKSSERSLTWAVTFSQWNSVNSGGLSYKMDEDDKWHYLDPGDRNIRLTELSGGNHIIQVKSQYGLSDAEVNSLSIPFSIEKKYYENKVFWFFLFVSLMLLIMLTSYIRSNQLRRKNILLEQKVMEKTRQVLEKNTQLEKTLDDLNEVMYALENKSNFQKRVISLIGHDMMIPLKYINKVSSQLIVYKNKLKEETKNESIAEINNTAASLAYLGEGIIQWIKLQESSFSAEIFHVKFAEILKELLPLHNRLAAEKGNTIFLNMEEDVSCTQDPVILKIILHNLLINANKFTSKGSLTIDVINVTGRLSITISDTGIGMPAEIKENLNQMRAVNSRRGTNKESGWGLGYRLIIDLLKLCSGNLHVESAEGAGTTILITLPDPLFVEEQQ